MSVSVSSDIDNFLRADSKATARVALSLPATGAWVLDDTRPSRVTAWENQTITHGSTKTILSVPSGTAGTVTMIQVAFACTTDDLPLIYGSELRIMADGAASPGEHATLGMFFGINGRNSGFHTDWLGTGTLTTDKQMGGFRAVEIPFTNGIQIDLINNSTTQSGSLFSQVVWKEGVDPAITAGASNRKVWHCHCLEAQAVSEFATADLLPSVSGVGELESVALYVQNGSNYGFLEGNPSVTVDGVAQTWGGTEDYFGGQYYWNNGASGFANNRFGGFLGTQIPGASAYGVSAFVKHYSYLRFPFTASLAVAWPNGQSGQSSAGAVTASWMTTYWTAA